MGAAGAALIARGMANSRKLEITFETVAIPGLPRPFEGFRLLHLTDLHLRRRTPWTAELPALADKVRPDLVCLGGDYANTALSLSEVEPFFARLTERWPAVGIYGNADNRRDIDDATRARWAERLPFLANTALPVERDGAQLWIAGVDDPHRGLDDLPAALAEVPPDAPVILLAHSPDVILRPLDPRVRLILCGHTHGGQICLPGGKALYSNTRLSSRYAAGRHALDGAVLYVSRGIGSTRLPLRYGCLPEATVFTLTRGEKV
jgi:hypothetical protein